MTDPDTLAARPILFSGAMVRALLDGRKTQTRRVVKYRVSGPNKPNTLDFYDGEKWKGACDSNGREGNALKLCPYGAPGDLLWVREEHYRFGHWEPVDGVRTKSGRQKWRFVAATDELRFEAPPTFRKGRHHRDPGTPAWHKRLARFMPRWASRITLKVTGVRVERLQEISEEDAIAEGVYTGKDGDLGPLDIAARPLYRSLWESINSPDSWAANPWVWVVSFERTP